MRWAGGVVAGMVYYRKREREEEKKERAEARAHENEGLGGLKARGINMLVARAMIRSTYAMHCRYMPQRTRADTHSGFPATIPYM